MLETETIALRQSTDVITLRTIRRIRVSAVGVALLLGACDSSGTSSEPTTKATRPAFGTIAPAKPEQSYTSKDLEKLLVPISKLPSGFSVRPPDDANETQVCNEHAIPRAPRTARAKVSFSSGQGAVLSEELTSYASAEAAASVMQNARAAYQRCKAFDKTGDDGRVTHYVVAPNSFERLADDQVAFRVTFDADVLSGTADFVAARVDGLIMATAGVSVSSTPGAEQHPPGDFASFTKTAYERIP